MAYPVYIKDLDHLRSNPMIKFKEETVDGETVTIVSYMIGNKEMWQLPNAKECRGITYSASGKVISATFEKFMNVGESEENLEHNLPWSKYIGADEKRDGSMISAVLINDKIFFKTKKSFYSDVAIEASKNASDNLKQMCHDAASAGITLTFEYTSPSTQVVLDYGTEPKFVLLAGRYLHDGSYVRRDTLEAMSVRYDVELIRSFDLTIDEIKFQKDVLVDFEGYVLKFDMGKGHIFRAKFKLTDYLNKHKARTQLRERDVADMVIAETLDDIKSVLVDSGLPLSPVEAIEKRVCDELAYTRDVVEEIVHEIKNDPKYVTVKDIALAFNGYLYFSLIMSEYKGGEPDYKKFWVRNYRDQYHLGTIYSNFVKGETE